MFVAGGAASAWKRNRNTNVYFW